MPSRKNLLYILMILVAIDRTLYLILTYGNIDHIFFGSVIVLLAAIFSVLALIKNYGVSNLSCFITAILEFITGIFNIVWWLFQVSFIPILGGVVASIIGASYIFMVYSLEEEQATVTQEGANDTPYAVELEDVHKYYYVGTVTIKALRGVSLKIRKGEFVSIMGPSGSGKSTLLNMIGALDRPTKGKVYVDGVDITKLDDDSLAELRNKKIGFIFQAFNLIGRTSVERNIEMPAIVAGMSRRKRYQKAKELLRIMGLDESALKRRPSQLSGGQQQRVAIARALMNDPTIILADEPTGNLDSKTGEEVMEYLTMLNRELGVTVIVVTHDRSVAEMADRILHIRDGKIVKEELVGDKK
ncbi:MAG: ATP-binding cassette domain-containing protein [Candidatus Njordarchaeota archaeon]